MIETIAINGLRRMKDSEGLIIQGCGGDLHEWVYGINNELTNAGVLLDGTEFKPEDCYTFTHEGTSCLLFPFSDKAKLAMGRLAMWRLETHETFGGTWLSDYVPNRLGGFITEPQKPDCPLIGQDGNIYNLVGIASQTLKENGLAEQAKEMCDRVFASGSYNEALGILCDYVNVTSVDEEKADQQFGGM